MTVLLQRRGLTVIDFRCQAHPADPPFEEVHEHHSLSFVRRGSFGCRAHGSSFELAAGGFFVGFPGDAFTCTHDHHDGGDECLSFQFSPELADEIGADVDAWRRVTIPPIAQLAVLGALAQSVADGHSGLGLDEAGMLLAGRFVDVTRGERRTPVRAMARDRRRCVEAAMWLNAHAGEPVKLEDAAAEAGISAFHFLRLFAQVMQITPHQYLILCRLRRAAEMLARPDDSVTEIALESGFEDLSNFERTFKRAAGVSPGRYRRLSRGDRNILQVRLAASAIT
jgi:AraC family transcriptional regulator